MFCNVLENDEDHSQKTGIGLCLTVSNKIVNALGGMMKMKSTVEVGTTFSFTVINDNQRQVSESIQPGKIPKRNQQLSTTKKLLLP
jgi:K+-sensing histidine kinase KdpD